MKIHHAIAVIAVLALPLPTTAAHAAEIKLLEGNALNAKDFSAYIHSETEKWGKVIQVSGIKLE